MGILGHSCHVKRIVFKWTSALLAARVALQAVLARRLGVFHGHIWLQRHVICLNDAYTTVHDHTARDYLRHGLRVRHTVFLVLKSRIAFVDKPLCESPVGETTSIIRVWQDCMQVATSCCNSINVHSWPYMLGRKHDTSTTLSCFDV